MHKGMLMAAIVVLSGCVSGPVQGQAVQVVNDSELRVSLTAVLEQVEDRDASDFVVGRGVDSSVTVGSWEGESINYARLLNILANNHVAAVEVDGTVNVVPFSQVRTMSLPAFEASGNQPDNVWAWHVAGTGDLDATSLVPLLRPLVPQEGHLAADVQSGKLMVVAPRGAIANLLAMVESLQ